MANFKFSTFYFALLLLFALGAAPPVKKGPTAAKVSLTTRLDKTALWVGDPLQYTIQAIHDSDVEFVLDNLKKENLRLSPFVVREVILRQGPFAGNKGRLEVTLLLTTYESGKTELTIPSFNLYYFIRKPGIGKKEEAPAATLPVPATKIGLRSTLAGESLKPRDMKAVTGIELREWLAPLLLGLSGMTFVAVRGARWAWVTLRAQRPKRRRLSRRAREKMRRDFLERIRAIGRESPDDLGRFYTEVSQFLRQYLSEWLEVEASGLTPAEIAKLLKEIERDGSLAQPIQAILEKCDRVRYAKDGTQLGQQWRGEILDEVERIVRRQGS